MDYFTRGIEEVPICKVNEDVVIDFLQENIMTRFGVPISLILIKRLNFHPLK